MNFVGRDRAWRIARDWALKQEPPIEKVGGFAGTRGSGYQPSGGISSQERALKCLVYDSKY
jgi:hypothetical protein